MSNSGEEKEKANVNVASNLHDSKESGRETKMNSVDEM